MYWITPDLGIPGETATGVYGGLDFLSKVRTRFTDLTKKPVVVVGESNTAMDCARSCIRLGAESVTVICPCDRKDMSARNRDVNRALEEGVRITFNERPVRILSNAMGCATGLVYAPLMCVAEEPGKSARTFNEQGSQARLPAELIIAASERKPDLNRRRLKPNDACSAEQLAMTINT